MSFREWSDVPGIRLINGDCLDVMPTLEAGAIDLILSDLPYGTTACKWDEVIPFEPLWACFKRVLKPRGAVVLTASQPFTSMLVMSNREWFKYCWVWEKSRPGDVFNAKNKPMKSHEDIVVFSSATTANGSPDRMTYNPQGVVAGGHAASNPRRRSSFMSPRPSHSSVHITDGTNYPRSVLRFANPNDASVHPTQKPIALFEYLIRTYSNEGETVLDATFGSGTTPVACVNTGRKFVGAEKDTEHGYFDIACRRVADAAAKTPLFAQA